MYKKVVGVVLVFLFSVTVGIQTAKPQYTQSGDAFILASPVVITSPVNGTYNSSELKLCVNFKFLSSPKYAQVNYSIDGKENCTLNLNGTQTPTERTRTYANGTTVVINSTFMVPFIITGSAVLPELENAPHNITVYAKYTATSKTGFDKQTVYFTVNRVSLKQNIEQNLDYPEWTPLLIVVFIVLVMVIFYKYILTKLD